MASTKIAVAGVTGMFGKQVVNALRKHSNVVVHGIARDTSKAPLSIKSDSRVKLFNADSEDVDGLCPAMRGTDVCICCYNGPDSLLVDGQKILIDACVSEGVPRYSASDFSFDIRGLKYGDFPFKDFQLKIKDYLSEKERAGQIRRVHCLNGAFEEVVVSPMIGIIDTESDTLRYWDTGDEPWDMTTVPDAASFVADVAIDKDANGFQAVRGDRKSIREIADIYERTYNTKVSLARQASIEELGKKMIALRQSEPDNVASWLGLHYTYFTLNGATLLDEADLRSYKGLSPKTLTQLVQETPKANPPTLLYG